MQEPPYAADTRAKGWRFELDYEKIDQSDTWAIAAEFPMAQPALLMMWLVSWSQEPCGSFPSDENVIRAKCRIPPKHWQALRSILMRGWVQAGDGRVYHPTITARVLEMLDYRKKTAERVAKFKLATREQRDGNALPTREVLVKNDTGTGTGTIEEKEKGARKRAVSEVPTSELLKAGFDERSAADFIAHKARMKAPLTARAWADHLRESEKAGWTPMAAADKVMAKSWKGFEAEYVAGEARNGVRPSFADQKATAAHTTVSSADADRTAQYLNDQRLSPEQKAKADEARKRAMASIGRVAA